MSDVKDYTTDVSETGNTHYNGVPSDFGRTVLKEQNMQPKYCMPGAAGGGMEGEKRNEQAGP
jgi:hypothetical protein